jgi:hypothetical protein
LLLVRFFICSGHSKDRRARQVVGLAPNEPCELLGSSGQTPLRTSDEQGTMLEMARYLKKAIVVEAVQWFKHGDHSAVIAESANGTTGYIDTPEGRLRVEPGDWIITGIAGENYPCKPDIFEQLYTPET